MAQSTISDTVTLQPAIKQDCWKGEGNCGNGLSTPEIQVIISVSFLHVLAKDKQADMDTVGLIRTGPLLIFSIFVCVITGSPLGE